MRPLRVAIVAPSLRILGGQAVQAEMLLRAWRDDSDVEAWLVPINPVPAGPLAHLTRIKYARTIVTQLVYWPLLLRELRHADVVHVFSASYLSFLLAPLPALLAARLLGKPVLINYHSGEAPDHLRRSWLARVALSRTDANVVPSSFLREVFARFGLSAEVIPNMVDMTHFRFTPRRPLRPRLVSTRNFEPHYNVSDTLRAFRTVQAHYGDASLTLVGAGSEERRLRLLTAELGVRNVTFAGRVPPSEIWRSYADADIYVQTPVIDNMPLSILEAFASGLPVVSTAAGGVPAILTDGVHGLLAPVGDHDAVARQLLRLLNDQTLVDRLTQAGLASCAAYTWGAVRKPWLSLYGRLALGIRRTPATLAPAAMTALRTGTTPPSAHADEDLRARAAEALAHLRHADGLAAELIAPYLALQVTWPAGAAYNQVPGPVRATVDSLRGRGGQPLVAAFHRAVLLCAMAMTRPTLRAHPAWSESVTLWDEATDRILNTLSRRSDADLDYPSDLWAKDIALASGRLWHAGAQLVEPRVGLSRRVLLQSGAPTLLRGAAMLVAIGGHYPLYGIHTANHTLTRLHFSPDGWAECYRRIARALARDPEAKGVFGAGWFFDPALERVSPHLAYLRQFPLDRGALILKVKTSDSGRRAALSNSITRRALHEAGKYDPQEHLMIWPRRAVLAWLSRGAT